MVKSNKANDSTVLCHQTGIHCDDTQLKASTLLTGVRGARRVLVSEEKGNNQYNLL